MAGYQTMDVLASIVFVIIIISAARDKGYTETKDTMSVVIKSSVFAAVALFVIYGGLAFLGATTSAGGFEGYNQTGLVVAITQSLIGTVVDFACPNKGETLHQGLELWHKKADGNCCCDYGFHMTIDDWNPGIEAEIDDMYAAGISSFKMYMPYPAMMIGDEAMYHALKKLKEKGGICGVHCENSGVIDALIAEKKAAGEMGVGSHPRTRPDFLEAEAVSRLLRIAQAVDIPVVIVHLMSCSAMFSAGGTGPFSHTGRRRSP